ncbi:hypothetical protein C7408_10435 [Paraburkholderia caballeronis]|nr:hypothetical protein C7406_12087 [Paraburkholderia caballeronis]TDV17382.1 hypothetical protein C7408_10435 [Paraburkholderia caballeronis]TDV27400.1 hypothetical protein C7404_10435 [Paraburkholderia caballeronis]
MGRRGHAASKRDTQPVPARIAAVAVVVAVVVCPARVVRLFSVRVLRGLLAACRVGRQRAGAAGVAEPDYRCAGSRVECSGFRTSVRAVARERRRIRALDSVIATLDNTRQRNALVSPLKRLRSTSQRAAPLPASATAGAAGASGLLGAAAVRCITGPAACARPATNCIRRRAARRLREGIGAGLVYDDAVRMRCRCVGGSRKSSVANRTATRSRVSRMQATRA